MKKVIITLSKVFPVTHSKKGEQTGFKDKLKNGEKIHTIRANKKGVWEKRCAEINNKEKYLSIRQWTGRPYITKQEEIDTRSKLGFQYIKIVLNFNSILCLVDNKIVPAKIIARNDGLSLQDFKEWFFGDKETGEFHGIILHFTDFRYYKSNRINIMEKEDLKGKLPYKPKDKELVWAWDDDFHLARLLCFYNAKKDAAFPINVGQYGCKYEHYAPYEGEWPDWAKKAYKMLED